MSRRLSAAAPAIVGSARADPVGVRGAPVLTTPTPAATRPGPGAMSRSGASTSARSPRHVCVIPEWYLHAMAMTLRLSPDDERVLAALAAEDGISRQEATIRAIHEVAAHRGHERDVRTLSAAARDRYADLLDRLGR